MGLFLGVSTSVLTAADKTLTIVPLDFFLSEWDGLYVTSYELLIPNLLTLRNSPGFQPEEGNSSPEREINLGWD